MGHLYVKELVGWVYRWRSVPVLAWAKAAAAFSAGAYEVAAQEYRRGLTRYSNHPVAPFARLDLAVCLERLGVYDDAIEQLTVLSEQSGTLQAVARARLAHTLFLSDRGAEGATLAKLLALDARQVRSRTNAELLVVKALAAFENHSHPELERELRVVGGSSTRETGSARVTSTRASRRWLKAVPAATTRVRDFPLKSANLDRSSGKEDVLSELQAYRSVNELVDLIIRAETEVDGISHLNAAAEARESDGLWIWIVAGQKLLEMKEPLRARRILNRALAVEPRAPKILSLLARTYLVSGEGYSPTFAVQLATKACQHAGWRSAKAHAALAECFYHSGDKLAALTVVQGSKSKLADPQIQLLLESLTEQLA